MYSISGHTAWSQLILELVTHNKNQYLYEEEFLPLITNQKIRLHNYNDLHYCYSRKIGEELN